MNPQSTFPTYETIGFSMFLEKPLVDNFSVQQPQTGNSSQLNFDSTQTSGSLGDKIQVGSITIDGSAGRIVISDGQNDRIIIGELP
jgi:hypothetical protein